MSAACPLPTADCLLPTAYCLLPTACPLPTSVCHLPACSLPPAAFCPLLIAHCLLPANCRLPTVPARRTHGYEARYGVLVLEADLNEAASRRTLARDNIWQGNCDLCGQQLRSNIASVRNTIPIQYPHKQLPCQKSSLQVAVSKARRATSLPFRRLIPPARFRYNTKTSRASGITLLRRASYPTHLLCVAAKLAGFLPSTPSDGQEHQ